RKSKNWRKKMILLRPDCLVFETCTGESIPCSATGVTIEFLGEAGYRLDKELIKNAATTMLHYFKEELKRTSVSVTEFSVALDPALPEPERSDCRIPPQLFKHRATWRKLRVSRFLGGQVMSKTLFEKIIAREIPADIVYEDDLVLAFRDVKPQAPVHVLIVPKKVIPRMAEASPEDHRVLGHLLLKAAELAASLGVKQTGYRLVINNGPNAGESVPH